LIIEIPFGTTTEKVIVDDDSAEIIYPKSCHTEDENLILKEALEKPINSQNLTDFIKNSDDLLIIVNDATRPTPTSKVLNMIFEEIRSKNFKFLIATGTHRAPTDTEYQYIFGDKYELIKGKIHVHDAKKPEDMAYFGTSKKGTEIYLNTLIKKADKIITINSVEPHYYAGYTGGRKSLIPGVASYKTTEQNHNFALYDGARTLRLGGNPVHEDMMDMLDKLGGKKIFSIQTVLDLNHKIYSASSGNIIDSFNECVTKANDVYSVPIKEKAEIVVTVASHPMDIDFYQSHKALVNGRSALKEGGILILVSECRDGLGKRTFFDYLSSSKNPEEVLEKTRQKYELGCHIAANIAKIVSKNEIWAVTSIDDTSIEKMFIKPYKHLKNALDDGRKKKGNPKVLFLMQGNVTVPIPIREEQRA